MNILDAQALIVFASLASGLFAAAILLAIGCAFQTVPAPQGAFEQQRLDKLREVHPPFARTYAAALAIPAPYVRLLIGSSTRYSDALAANSQYATMQADEFARWRIVEGLFMGLAIGLASVFFNPIAPLIAIPLAMLAMPMFWTELAFSTVVSENVKRQRAIKNRLPYALDLMGLMMAAGASLEDAIGTTVADNPNTEIGEEFASILRQIEFGKTRSDVFANLGQQWTDSDLREVVVALNRGQQMGTPIANLLIQQAEILKLKRTQWIEKASGEAQVKILFPGLLIMLGCLMIIVAPILLRLLTGSEG